MQVLRARTSVSRFVLLERSMTASSPSRTYTSHVERTAREPRDDDLHTVVLSKISGRDKNGVRLLRLSIPAGNPPIKFQPGQWLDVHAPGISKPGGFTITSVPSKAFPFPQPPISGQTYQAIRDTLKEPLPLYVELAVQKNPKNPVAAYLWKDPSEILNQKLQVRVGGSFVWPPQPPAIDAKNVKRLILIAGGVGINPLISIVSHIAVDKASLQDCPFEVKFLYTTRSPGGAWTAEDILFLNELAEMFLGTDPNMHTLDLFITSGHEKPDGRNGKIETIRGTLEYKTRRIEEGDLLNALGTVEDRKNTVCYICGVPTMTDKFVETAQKAAGMDPNNVLFERWW